MAGRTSRGASAALLLAFASSLGTAWALDPTLAHELRVGTPRGFAISARLDAARTGRAHSALPRNPRIVWRSRVTGSIDWPAVIDQHGSIALVSTVSLTQISSVGAVEWVLGFESAPPVTAPALTSDGLRVLLTASGELLGISARGHIRKRAQLPLRVVRSAVPLLPLEDGGLIVATSGDVLRLDANYAIVAQARVNDEVRSVVVSGHGLLIATELGDVYGWASPVPLTKLGSFGGRTPEGAALSSPERLTAVVDHARIVDFDVVTHSRFLRTSSAGAALLGPPAITAHGESRVLSTDGLLLGHDPAGRETVHMAVELAPNGAERGFALAGAAPPLLVDPQGLVAFARPGSQVGVVDLNGEIRTADGSGCFDPVSLTPAGPARLLLACRSGQLWLLSDKGP